MSLHLASLFLKLWEIVQWLPFLGLLTGFAYMHFYTCSRKDFSVEKLDWYMKLYFIGFIPLLVFICMNVLVALNGYSVRTGINAPILIWFLFSIAGVVIARNRVKQEICG